MTRPPRILDLTIARHRKLREKLREEQRAFEKLKEEVAESTRLAIAKSRIALQKERLAENRYQDYHLRYDDNPETLPKKLPPNITPFEKK